MAIIINSEKGVFNLPNDFKVEIEITSPIYNEKGVELLALLFREQSTIYPW